VSLPDDQTLQGVVGIRLEFRIVTGGESARLELHVLGCEEGRVAFHLSGLALIKQLSPAALR